ncbi:MAG: hypothetical protein Aurels2KO_39400 [Aureliella sp.]
MPSQSPMTTRMPAHPLTGIPVWCAERGYVLTTLSRTSATLHAGGFAIELKPALIVLFSGFGPWHHVPRALATLVATRNQNLHRIGWQLSGELKLLCPILRFPSEQKALPGLLDELLAEATVFAAKLRANGIWQCDSLTQTHGE